MFSHKSQDLTVKSIWFNCRKNYGQEFLPYFKGMKVDLECRSFIDHTILMLYLDACEYPNPGLVLTMLQKSESNMVNHVSKDDGSYALLTAMYRRVPFKIV